MQLPQSTHAAIQQKRITYAHFEKTVLDLYERKLLTLDRLDHIANHYRCLPIDSAGSQGITTGDGKDLHQICIELIEPSFFHSVAQAYPNNEETWELELKKWEDIICYRWHWQAYGITTTIPHHQQKAA